jgi:O-acetyl-ADP-ribose deacetylase (regulator of RNase III)
MPSQDASSGLDLTPVKEVDGVFSTKVGECEIRVMFGRIETCKGEEHAAFVLPCDEYFDCCVDDSRTALGMFVRSVFEGQASELDTLIKQQCASKFGPGTLEQKTDVSQANSFGPGKCVLLIRPLNHSVHVALVSTAVQRAPGGVAGRMSYIFDAMRDLARSLGQGRIRSVIMPVLGAGHAGMKPALALVGVLLAVAEVAYYAEPGERLKRVTIVVFKKDADSSPEVDPVVIRRALALVARK